MKKLIDVIKSANNWNDIFSQFKKLNVEKDRSAGKLFEHFCKIYFQHEPSVCNQYKNVWLFSETPLKVKTKLNLGAIDYGIDLVLEDHERKFSAVQCKFRNDQSTTLSWSKDKITNILAEGDKADYFIIFTNASGLDKHTLTKKQSRLKLISLGDLLEISPQTIKHIKETLRGRKKAFIKIKKPRPYQKKAIQAVVKGFKKANRGQLILPCGTGKTLISLWIQQALKANRTLVLVPSLALLRQTKKEWSANGQKLPYLCVCSEQDIDAGQDNIITHTYEIPGNVTTSPKEIASFIKKHKKFIIYSTYQSLKCIASATKGKKLSFDLALCDEAHKTAGSKLGAFALIHNDSKVKVAKRLYMTATPRIISQNEKNKVGEEVLKYLCDMSDIKLFGHEFYRMSFKEAIDKEILVDYKIVAIGVSDSELQKAIHNRMFIGEGQTIDEIANNYALDKFMNEYKAKHAITFHSSVRKARDFQERHQNLYSNVDSFHVNGTQSTNNRNVQMSGFQQSEKSIITNARCLTEGIDVSAIDTVYFSDPRNSKIDIVQASGRALRKYYSGNKDCGYIVVPIFHRESDKLKQMIDSGPFKNLVSVVKALSSQDERLVDEIKSIKLGGQKPFPSSKGHISGVDDISLILIEGFEEKLSSSMFTQIIEKTPIPYRGFENARGFVHKLMLKGEQDWRLFLKTGKLPKDIPSKPDRVYKSSGWESWGDWLGTGSIAPKKRKYLSFDEARKLVHDLKLSGEHAWRLYCKTKKLTNKIPTKPDRVYKNKGWKDWGDWLGTGKIASSKIVYRPYLQAKKFAHSLNLKSANEWRAFTKGKNLPNDIPACPNQTYKNDGWTTWGEWLGNNNKSPSLNNYREFNDAREYVRNLHLKNGNEWKNYCSSGKKPKDLPGDPRNVYCGKGWISMGDWLGTFTLGPKEHKFRDFYSARKYVRKLKLSGEQSWRSYCKSSVKPKDIPATPENIYKNKGWISWGNWLGTDSVASSKRKYLSFDNAREFVRKLKLKGDKEWRTYCKSGNKPKNIPYNPAKNYKNEGWISLGDWLGTSKVASSKRNYLPFEDARHYVRKLKIANDREWRTYCKSGRKPSDIPGNPQLVYKNSGWLSLSDWLGTKNVAPKKRIFLPYDEAKQYVHSLSLKNEKEWRSFCRSRKRPLYIPWSPDQVYKNKGWISWGDWFGTKIIYQSFEQARAFVHSLKFKNGKDWQKYVNSGKKPEDIPSDPYRTYRYIGWISLADWLGA